MYIFINKQNKLINIIKNIDIKKRKYLSLNLKISKSIFIFKKVSENLKKSLILSYIFRKRFSFLNKSKFTFVRKCNFFKKLYYFLRKDTFLKKAI